MTWLSIIIIIAIILVLADGFLRKFRSRSSLRVKLEKNISAGARAEEELLGPEFPSGGARTIRRRKASAFSAAGEDDELPEEDSVSDDTALEKSRDGGEGYADEDDSPIIEDPIETNIPDEPETPARQPLHEEGGNGEDTIYETFDDDWDDDAVGEARMVAEKDDAPVRHRGKKRAVPDQVFQNELPLDKEGAFEDEEVVDDIDSDAGDDDDESEVEEVIVINVMAPPDSVLAGKKMLPILLKQEMRLGNMSIFHRHADSSGSGPVMFSMANMVKPGTFDMAQMDDFSTPGVSLFLQLPGKHKSFMQSFEHMLETANALKEGLGGELKDENRSVLTRQTVEHYRQRIRDFELQQLSRK